MPGARLAALLLATLVGLLAAHQISPGAHENGRSAHILSDFALTRAILRRAISFTNATGRAPDSGPIARPCHAQRPSSPCSAWDAVLPRDPRCADGSAAVFIADTTTYEVFCHDAGATIRSIHPR